MKKILRWSLAALLVTAGCASHSTSNTDGHVYGSNAPIVEKTDKSAPVKGEVTGFAKERKPAQALDTHWVRDSASIKVSPRGGVYNVTLSPRLIESYMEKYPYTCDQYQWGRSTCDDYVCDGGTGKSDLWNAYYNGRKENKVAALDHALLGIGPASAQRLESAHIFSAGKPASWMEFRERMNKALTSGAITADQYREVFGTYGQQNRANLGYAGEKCRVQLTSCQVWGLFPKENGCEGNRPAERVLEAYTRPIQVTFNSPNLQSFETETVVVSAAETMNSIEVQRSDKTDYKLTSIVPNGNGATIVMDGVGRFQVALPRESFVGIKFNDSRGNNMNAVVSVDPNFIGQGDDKLIAAISVAYCDPGGFWSVGVCKGNDEEAKTKLPTVYQTIKEATSSFALPTIPAGKKVIVTYSIHRENSRWYTNSPVGENTQVLKELKK